MLWVSVIYFCINFLLFEKLFYANFVFKHSQIPHQLVGVPLGFNITLECFTEGIYELSQSDHGGF